MYLDLCICDFMRFGSTIKSLKKLSYALCANRNGLKVIEMNENKTTKIIGEMDNTIDHTFESSNRVYDKEGIAPTLPTCCGGGHQPKIIDNPKYRIRKLTPKECFRLMSFSDSDFKKAENVNSNSQLYKQAGNSIVENCLIAIFSQLNIQNTKSWNDRTEAEKHELIESRFQK